MQSLITDRPVRPEQTVLARRPVRPERPVDGGLSARTVQAMRAAPSRPDHRQRWARIALGLAAVGAIAPLLPAGPGRLIALLVFSLLAPGAALVAHLRDPGPVPGAAIALTASATVLATATAAEVWWHLWYPGALHVALVVLAVAGGLARVLQPGSARRRTRGLVLVRPDLRPAALLPGLALLVALVLVGLVAGTADWTAINGYGLTVSVGAPLIAAIILPVVALVVELVHRQRVAVLAASAAVMVISTQAVAPLMLPTPEYSWTYKHFGVVDLFSAVGHVVDPSDVYQQWPAFFTGAAHLSTLAGLGPEHYATWSSTLRSLINLIVVAAVFRALSDDRRVIWTGVFLSVALLWVDQIYFAPQGFAYTLALGFFAIVLTYLRDDPRLPTSRGPDPTSVLSSMRRTVLRGLPATPPCSARVRGVALIGAVAVFVPIIASHQLTPYIVAVGIVSLGVLGLLRPRWLGPLLLVLAVLYLVPRYGSVSHFSIFDVDVFRNAGGNKTSIRTPEQAFSADAVRVLALGTWGLTLLVAVLRFREIGTMAVPVVLGFSPMIFLAVGSYGGEAIYRVFMFSLPWCAFILGREMVRCLDRLPSGLTRRWAAGTGLIVMLSVATLAAQQGLQGQFALNRVPPADVVAVRHLETTIAPGSSIALLVADAPTRSTRNYGAINVGRPTDTVVLDDPEFLGATLTTPQELDHVLSYVRKLGGPDQYLIVSRQMATSAAFFGLVPPGAIDHVRNELRNSLQWRIVVDNPEIGIYRVAHPPQ